jgi:hypothetical protein
MSLEQINGDGFRYYRYDPEDGSEVVDLLSVTSIRSLCGESYNLVNWKLANIADAALGTQKRTVIGPRGGVKDVRQVWEYPSEFARKYTESEGVQSKIDSLRSWLRDRADHPRNVAAVRGTLVHGAIERDIQWERATRPYVESAFADLSGRDRKKIGRDINDDDVAFVQNSLRHYWLLREMVPFVILAREVRVVNLTVGYAGTFDALVWMLPKGVDAMQVRRETEMAAITLETVERYGGEVVLVDWKTATGIHTDYVVQTHAYLAAEFAIVNGKRDERVTNLLTAAQVGGIAHIRPNKCALHLFNFSAETVRAFVGSVAFARFLAKYPHPDSLWTATYRVADTKGDDNEEAGDD